MKPKYNYHYSPKYKPLYKFKFDKKNDTVSLVTYKAKVLLRLPTVIENLKLNPHSRQEVILVNTYDDIACLISIQVLIIRNRLTLIANYRSQDKNLGRPYDVDMLRYVATLLMNALKLKKCKLLCNVANYHERTVKNPTGY